MRYGALSSSYDPEKLSMTVKGILVGIIPVILILSNAAGWGDAINNQTLSSLVDLIVVAIQNIGGAIAAVMAIYGALRRIAVAAGWVQPRNSE